MTSAIDISVNEPSYSQAACLVQFWAQARQNRTVYETSVYGTIEAHKQPDFWQILTLSDHSGWHSIIINYALKDSV